MKFERTKITAEVYGEKFELRRPTVDEVQEYSKKAKDISEEESIGLLLSFLDGVGLPKKVSKEMEFGHLDQLFKAVVPPVKK